MHFELGEKIVPKKLSHQRNFLHSGNDRRPYRTGSSAYSLCGYPQRNVRVNLHYPRLPLRDVQEALRPTDFAL